MPDECIDMEEKDPDIIPTNKGNFFFAFTIFAFSKSVLDHGFKQFLASISGILIFIVT